MSRPAPVFDYSLCIACRVCVQACPFSCIDMSRTGGDPYGKVYPELTGQDRCTGCRLCERSCPVDCIAMLERV